IFRRVAKAMGLTEPALYASDEELLADALGGDHPGRPKVSIAELRDRGFARLDYPEPFLPYADRYDTPSGRFEFSSDQAEQDGQGRLPHYVAPKEATAPSGEGQEQTVALIAAANHYLMNSTFANSPNHARSGAQTVALHPDDARLRSIRTRDTVRVHNDRGEFVAVAEVTKRTRPGVATMTKGHWPKLVGGSSINATTAERDADMARGAVFHDNQVAITLVEPGPDGDSAMLTSEAAR
ncbi:MAG: molybdopterin oxidoreductase family protein, partial [Actinobacteria bacterium]|nr:molybdopterin oxidoreductase family protein [Actinomycetota bacterium]